MTFEVCCGSVEDACNAFLGGADRIELNSALFLGGLTPSVATLRQVKKLIDIPIMAMVRPREGGFCYTKQELSTMREDAQILLENGADGLVFGFLLEDGRIDWEHCAEFVEICQEKEAVFSRAIDVCPDLLQAVHELAELGIDRVLTSGGEISAERGMEQIKQMKEAAGQMEILPGGGIRIENARKILEYTGVDQLHASMRKLCYDTSVRANPKIYFGGAIEGKHNPEDVYKVTDSQAVRAMKELFV